METEYDNRFVRQAFVLGRMGLSDLQMAIYFDVKLATVLIWKQAHEAFGAAYRAGEALAE